MHEDPLSIEFISFENAKFIYSESLHPNQQQVVTPLIANW